MRIGLISDTHGLLRPQVFDAFEGVDLILHAGDIGSADILDELESIAPVHAVLGNTDSRALAPRASKEVQLVLEGFLIMLVHGHVLGSPTPAALHELSPEADIIIYGHTHRQSVDLVDDCLVINPGAAGAARFGLAPAVAILELAAGAEPVVRHVEMD